MKKRRPLTKAELIARLPRGLRPKLVHEQVRDLALTHIINLDVIARGEADEEVLWQVIGGTYTWSFVAADLKRHEADMAQQLQLCEALLQRYRRTGRVVYTGPEYQLAKAGVAVMDRLAELVDQPTASRCADRSQALIDSLQPQCEEATA